MVSVCKALSRRRLCDHRFTRGHEHGFQSDRFGPRLIVTTADVSAARCGQGHLSVGRDWKHQPGLVVDRYNAQLSRQLRDIDDILDILSIDLLGVVPEHKSIVLATDRGQPIALNRRHYVSQAYHNMAQRVMGNNVPLMDFREPGFFNALARLFGR